MKSPRAESSTSKRRRVDTVSSLGGYATPLSGAQSPARSPSQSSFLRSPASQRGSDSFAPSTPSQGIFALPADSGLAQAGKRNNDPKLYGLFAPPTDGSALGSLDRDATSPATVDNPLSQSQRPSTGSAQKPRGLTSLLSRSFTSPRISTSESVGTSPQPPSSAPRGLSSLLTGKRKSALNSQSSSPTNSNGTASSSSGYIPSQPGDMKNVEGGLPPLQGAVSFKPGAYFILFVLCVSTKVLCSAINRVHLYFGEPRASSDHLTMYAKKQALIILLCRHLQRMQAVARIFTDRMYLTIIECMCVLRNFIQQR